MARAAAGFLPFVFMVIVQICLAGMNIISKLAMDSGMKPLVLVAYRQILATLAILPFACIFEWRIRPKITMQILFQIFLCSLTGATGNQVFYFVGLENSTPTIGCALANILPAVTFILAVIFRQETVKIKKRSGQAKVLGTVICVGGAMLLSFYHGHLLGIPASKIHWDFVDKVSKDDTATKSNFILGSMELLASSTSWAVWFIIQNKVSEKFPAPYTSTTLMCFMGSVECGAIALITNHQLSDWSLKSTIRLIASLHAGILGSGLGFYLTSWCIQRRGALYVSVFSPLLLVAVAIASWALLREKLYVGTVVGSVMIVGGLYTVLWGKDKEIQSSSENKEKNKKGAGGDNTDLEDHQEMPTANLNCKHQTAEG